MTQVSRYQIKKEVWDRIFDLFLETIADVKDKKELEEFLNEFFSPTERIVFAKRLSCLILLHKGHDYQSIHWILKLSPPTIAKLNMTLKYGKGGFEPVIQKAIKKQDKKLLFEELKDIADLPRKQIYDPERLKRQGRRRQKMKEIGEAV